MEKSWLSVQCIYYFNCIQNVWDGRVERLYELAWIPCDCGAELQPGYGGSKVSRGDCGECRVYRIPELLDEVQTRNGRIKGTEDDLGCLLLDLL